MQAHNWIIDFRGDSRANMYRVLKTLAAKRSQYQEILIVDTLGFGRALFLDGIPQSAASDEYIYHEALVHPALIAHSEPKKVCIAGGGEGAVLREVLKHHTVERVIMVDIDDVMIDFAKQYLVDWHCGAFDNNRVQLVHDDIRRYLSETQEMFDCILLDTTDPLEGGLAALLFTAEFFTLAKSHLNTGGTFGMQAETTDSGTYTAHVSIIKTLRSCFTTVFSYGTPISFYGLAWGFAVASDLAIEHRFNPPTLAQALRERSCSDLKFYDPESHLHMFSLPKYLRDAIEDPSVGMIIHDDQLLVVE